MRNLRLTLNPSLRVLCESQAFVNGRYLKSGEILRFSNSGFESTTTPDLNFELEFSKLRRALNISHTEEQASSNDY